MFFDRPIYSTTDTIKVFGVATSRNPNYVTSPEVVSVVLTDEWWGSENVYAKTKANVNSDGTFIATLDYSRMKAGYYNVYVKVGDLVITGKWLEISEYEKPVYLTSSHPEETVYVLDSNSEVSVDVNLSFSDKTPVPRAEIKLKEEAYGKNVAGQETWAITDAGGNAKARLLLTSQSENNSYPVRHSYKYTVTGPSSETLKGNGVIYAFHRDVMMNTAMKSRDSSAEVTVMTNLIDISKVKTTSDIFNRDLCKGEAYDTEITAELWRIYYTKTAIGYRFDYGTSQYITKYRYSSYEEIVETFTKNTDKGVALFDDLQVSDKDSTYYLKISCKDSQGRLIRQYRYIYNSNSYFGRNGNYSYGLIKKEQFPPSDSQESYSEDDSFYFNDKERVTFELSKNGESVENANGRILYCVVNNRFIMSGISSSSVKISFKEDLVPFYVITGAYFDGKYIHALNNTNMQFVSDAREISISYKYDKKQYSPGDTVNLTITAKNKSTGRAVPGASVAVSVVDEAIFAIREQYVNFLERLTGWGYHPDIKKYVSNYLPPEVDQGGMGDGGGDGKPRSDFRDTAYFTVTKTNSYGNAVVSFKVPDNLTSWRVTSLVYTKDFHAGDFKDTFVSTLPYFVVPIVNESLLVGETCSFGVVSSGTALKDESFAKYKVSIKGKNTSISKEIEFSAREYTSVIFDETKLEAGNYTVTIEGKSEGYRDAIQLPFEVVESRLEVPIFETFSLGIDEVSVFPLRSPIKAVFYTESMSDYRRVLGVAQYSINGTRGDVRIARYYVSSYMPDVGIYVSKNFSYTKIDDVDGSGEMRLFPYESTNREFAVRAVLCFPEIVSRKCLEQQNYSYSEQPELSPIDVLAETLLGKVPKNLIGIYDEYKKEDYVGRAYLAIALYKAGYKTKANEIYKELVTDRLKTGNYKKTEYLYIDKTGFEQSSEKCNSAALLLSCVMRTDDSLGLALYFTNNTNAENIYPIELVYFVKQFKTNFTNSASFSYKRNGRENTVKISYYPVFLSFMTDEFEKADFKVKKGDVLMDVYYVGDTAKLGEKHGNNINIVKTITKVNGSGPLAVGDIVRVAISPLIPEKDRTMFNGCFYIKEYIPSCMRYDSYEGGSWGVERQKQELTFYYYPSWRGSQIIVYYARVVTPGDFIAEGSYIIERSGSSYGVSQNQIILVNEFKS